MPDCTRQVYVATRRDGSSVLRQCGTYYAGILVLCGPHLAAAQKSYPQGWRAYPGDTCKHGVYVGGVMEDFMCAQCEMGE